MTEIIKPAPRKRKVLYTIVFIMMIFTIKELIKEIENKLGVNNENENTK